MGPLTHYVIVQEVRLGLNNLPSLFFVLVSPPSVSFPHSRIRLGAKTQNTFINDQSRNENLNTFLLHLVHFPFLNINIYNTGFCIQTRIVNSTTNNLNFYRGENAFCNIKANKLSLRNVEFREKKMRAKESLFYSESLFFHIL